MNTEITEFEIHRKRLFGIAYRMLGSVMDAQDIVQDTYVQWQGSPRDEIRSSRAWLTTVATRLCINRLKSARAQRETYVGLWLPEPLAPDPDGPTEDPSRLADSLSLAFLVLLETLTPTERAVFLLREALDMTFAEIGNIVDRSEANCRQILTRARKHLGRRQLRFEATPEEAEAILNRFQEAVRSGATDTLLQLLAPDADLLSDGGGKAPALLDPVQGAREIAHVVVEATRRFGALVEHEVSTTVNGIPALVGMSAPHIILVRAFLIRDGRIRTLYVITNPEKLQHLTRGQFP